MPDRMKQPTSSKQREQEFHRTKGDPNAAPHRSDGTPNRDAKPKADKATRRKYLREYRKWLWPYRWGLFTVLGLALITTTLDMVWPLAIKRIMDGVLVDSSAPREARINELLRV